MPSPIELRRNSQSVIPVPGAFACTPSNGNNATQLEHVSSDFVLTTTTAATATGPAEGRHEEQQLAADAVSGIVDNRRSSETTLNANMNAHLSLDANVNSATYCGSSELLSEDSMRQNDHHRDRHQQLDDPEALHAVRVDDIMTVKAEPVDEKRARRRLILLGGGLLLLIVVLVIIVVVVVVTSNLSNDEEDEELAVAAPPTYAPETRFQLLRDMLVERFGPMYDKNYALGHNSSFSVSADESYSGVEHLRAAFANTRTPQHKALWWLANNDTLLEMLEEPFFEIENNTVLGHDRIHQRYVLVLLFFATGGSSSWTDSLNFLSEGNECDWSLAIGCSNEQGTDSVTHLELAENNLMGSLPLELGALTHLEALQMAKNYLTGTLPVTLETLTALKTVNLGFNSISGTIPVSFYQNWRQLQIWDMSSCSISGTFPSEIGFLSELETFVWGRNQMHGTIPSEFWRQLTNIGFLDFSQQLTAEKYSKDIIPTEIGLWKNLTNLVYHGLDLRGSIPSEIGLLTNMESLQISSNDLTGNIPSELGALTATTRLALSLNALTGTVPSTFVRLTSLERLYLQNTLLTGDIAFMCEAIANGTLLRMDPFRVDQQEVSGCTCCTCCEY